MDAMVATALAGMALGALASIATLSTRSLRLARDTGTALALAGERLETLRAGQTGPADDEHVAPDGTRFRRRCQESGGRGTPRRLSVRIDWTGHALELASAVAP